MATKHADTVSIVSPDWILDSIDMGMRLSEKDYHPSVFRSSRSEEPNQGQLSCDEIQEEVAATVSTNTGRGCNGELPIQTDPLARGGVTTTIAGNSTAAKHHKGRGSAVDTSAITTGISAFSHGALTPGSREYGGAEEGRMVSEKNAVGLSGQVGTDLLGQTVASRERETRCGANGTQNSTAETFVSADTGTSSTRKRSQSTVPTSPDALNPSPSHNKMAGLSSSSSNTLARPLERAEGGSSVAPRLLEGVTLCFSDYQECVDQDTLSKWKEVGPCCEYMYSCMQLPQPI